MAEDILAPLAGKIIKMHIKLGTKIEKTEKNQFEPKKVCTCHHVLKTNKSSAQYT